MAWEGYEARHMHKASLACKEGDETRHMQATEEARRSMRKLTRIKQLLSCTGDYVQGQRGFLVFFAECVFSKWARCLRVNKRKQDIL